MKRRVRTLRTGLMAALLLAMPAAAQEKPLKIIVVDVEGGAATLFLTPEGQSLLIDTGWPAGSGQMPSPDGSKESADRIAAAAKKLGIKKLDYVLVTHYHDDHSGGAAALAKLRAASAGAFTPVSFSVWNGLAGSMLP